MYLLLLNIFYTFWVFWGISSTRLYMMYYKDYMGTRMLLPVTVRHLHLEGTDFNSFDSNELRNLQSLYLDGYRHYPYVNIPSTAVNLQILSCRDCGLYSSFYDFFQYSRNALKFLDLSYNSLTNLPGGLLSDRAKNLESLLLSNNQFTEMTDVQNLTRLQGLVLSYNQIDQVADIKSDSLKMLSLRGNKIITINDSTFQKLPVLEVLDLSENKLISMPDGWASGLKNLVTLNLKSNLFVSLSNTSLKTATSTKIHLHIRGNPIERILVEDILLLPYNCTLHVMSHGRTANKNSNDD